MNVLKKSFLEVFKQIIFLRNQPLTIKLFVFSTILVIIPLIVVGIISYHKSSVELEREEQDYNLQIIEQVKSNIEYYERDFEISILKILNHPDTIALLKMQTPEEVEQSKIRNSIQSILHNTVYSRADISNISIIINNLQVIDSVGYKSPYPVSSLEKEYWYSSVPVDGSSMLISRFIEWPDRKEPVISIVKRIHSPYTLKPIGMIIVDVNFKRIQEIAGNVNPGKNGHFYILDAEGHYVYSANQSKLGQKADFLNPDVIFSKSVNSGIINNNKDFLTYSNSSLLGWRFVTSVPYAEIRKGSSHIGQTIAWTLIITLIIAYLLGILFASSIVNPIRRLQRFLKNIEVGDFSKRVKVDSTDEIGQLSEGFNRMLERLSELMEEIYFSKLRETEGMLRQKEMELKILQSQINPHFLCNSLETIRGMALEKGIEDIATMSASLGQLLRYNLRSHSHTVTLREELKFCEVYLQIQQFRFEDRFSYVFDIPEWALEILIPKFSLQPLVENCFIHAFGLAKQFIHIRILAVQMNDGIVIQICDDGMGIAEEVLDKIHENLQHVDIIEVDKNIGILNVHRRIINLFGTGYGVTVKSQIGIGTQINVHLPIKKLIVGEIHGQ